MFPIIVNNSQPINIGVIILLRKLDMPLKYLDMKKQNMYMV